MTQVTKLNKKIEAIKSWVVLVLMKLSRMRVFPLNIFLNSNN